MTTVNTLIYSSTIDAYVFMCFLIYRLKFLSCARTTYHRSKNLNSRFRERVSFLQNPLQLSSCIGDNIYGLDTIYIYTKLILAYLKVCYKNVLLHIILVYSKYIYEAFLLFLNVNL